MKIKDNNFFYINIIVVVFFVFAMDLPRNLYNLLLHKYANRIYSIYGVCEKESYGYLEKIVNQYGTKGIKDS